MVIWITGMSGAGKTTLAKQLRSDFLSKNIPSIIIDGDETRKIIDVDFSNEGRRTNIMFAAKLASLIERQGTVAIVAMVSPKKIWRNAARKLFSESILIYVQGGYLWKNTIYEIPEITEIDFMYDHKY